MYVNVDGIFSLQEKRQLPVSLSIRFSKADARNTLRILPPQARLLVTMIALLQG